MKSHRLRAAVLAFAVSPGGACDRDDRPKFERLEQPQSRPQAVALPAVPGQGEASPDDPRIAACTPGTGRNAAGTCEPLRTRQAPHAQQVQLPSGTTVMGFSPATYDAAAVREAPAARWSGQPARTATMDGFWIDLHEVTRAAYATCVGTGACAPAECPGEPDPVAAIDELLRPQVPQTCVTHAQAAGFCAAQAARLPSEAEWEYAARGPTARRFPWGDAIQDEFGAGLFAVTGPVDFSYFGIRGLGTNGHEWVAEPYDPDAGTAAFVRAPFRRADGPLRRALASTRGFIVKGAHVGGRDLGHGPAPDRGFRCADDLAPSEAALTLPTPAPNVRVVAGERLQVFAGVAEAVDRREAATFCTVLAVTHDGERLADFRLPRLAELAELGADFRGPGPFWTREGAAGYEPGADGVAQWAAVAAAPGDALMARCIRG